MGQVIALPFRFTESGGINTSIDEKKMWSDRVISALLTRPTERVMNPNYGSGLTGLVFENDFEASQTAKLYVEGAFSRWLTELQLLGVNAYLDQGELAENTLVISVEYLLPSGEKNVTTTRIKSGTFTRTGILIEEYN